MYLRLAVGLATASSETDETIARLFALPGGERLLLELLAGVLPRRAL